MASWLIPVQSKIYDIDRAFHELSEIYWAKYDYEYQKGDKKGWIFKLVEDIV